ncbi:MAG: hypothetical protein ACFFD1_05600 [Candidatus Thorarchaeota archaeon]
MVIIDRSGCYKCKGDLSLCAPHRCPMRVKLYGLQPVEKAFKNSKIIDGFNPPSFFVGSQNWPNVSVNPMFSVLDQPPRLIDEPDLWKTQFQIPDIVKFRTHLFRAKIGRINVKNKQKTSINPRTLNQIQELLMAKNPTQLNVEFAKPIKFNLKFNTFISPIGPGGKMKAFSIEDTPKIDHRIEKVVEDTDLTAKYAIEELWDQNLSITQINRILSAGMLGLEKKRHIVPTRWAITATDDQIAKKMMEKIKEFPEIDHFEVWYSDYLDNHFRILLRPFEFSFEFIEFWKNPQGWSFGHDYEFFEGRTSYAKSSVGGYYATRLAVVEYLFKILRKQAEVVVFREVGEDYYIPLGVWQVRENVRSAFSSNKMVYSGNNEKEALEKLFKDLMIKTDEIKNRSIILYRRTHRKKLTQFI